MLWAGVLTLIAVSPAHPHSLRHREQCLLYLDHHHRHHSGVQVSSDSSDQRAVP